MAVGGGGVGSALDEDLETFDRFDVYRGMEEFRAYRGEPVEEMLAEHEQLSATATDRHVELSGRPCRV